MKKLLLIIVFMYNYSVIAQANCSSAIAITANGSYTAPAITGTFSNSCYNNTLTDAGGAMAGIWYSFTPSSNGEVFITSNLATNVAPKSTDTKLSIFTGTCSSLTCYDANDDFSSTVFLSDLTFPVTGGTTYYIQWDNYWDANGFDFNFTFTPLTCVKPFYFNAPNIISSTSVTLSWDAAIGNPSQYEVEYGPSGFAQGSGTVVTTGTTSVNLTGLSVGTLYDYYVRSICSTTDSSTYNKDSFLTPVVCPYSSGFDSTTQLQGWTTSTNTTTQSLGLGTTAANAQSPSQYFIFNNSTTQAVNNWLFTPAFYLTSGEQVTATFYTRCATSRSFKLTVGSSNTSASQSTVVWNNAALLNSSYTQQTATYTAPSTGIYYFGFNDYSATAAAVATLRLDTVSFTSVLKNQDFMISDLHIGPNPTKDILNIASNGSILNNIQVTDINGRTVKNVTLSNVAEAQINIADLSAGVYMMKVTSDKGTVTKKIIKE